MTMPPRPLLGFAEGMIDVIRERLGTKFRIRQTDKANANGIGCGFEVTTADDGKASGGFIIVPKGDDDWSAFINATGGADINDIASLAESILEEVRDGALTIE